MSLLKVSVVICTYNRSSLLAESINSIQQQGYPFDSWEIIVVDNNSSDDTMQKVRELSIVSPVPIKYLVEKEQGLSYARNAGIGQAAGNIVVFTDDDIEADKSWLSSLVAAFDSPDIACTGGPIRPLWEVSKPEWLTDEWLTYLTINEFGSAREQGEFKHPEYPYGANIAFRRDVFEQLGFFPTDLGRKGTNLLSNEEVMLCHRIMLSGKKIKFAPEAVIYHKISKQRLTKQWFYHRTYWQGRSEALTDLRLGGTLSSDHLKYFSSEAFFHYCSSLKGDFTSVCRSRLALGYFEQVLESNKSKFKRLRALSVMIREVLRQNQRLMNDADEKIGKQEEFLAYRAREVERFEQIIHDSGAKLAAAQNELNKHYQEIGDLTKSLVELTNQLKNREAIIHEMEHSMSWKITKPLRFLSYAKRKIVTHITKFI